MIGTVATTHIGRILIALNAEGQRKVTHTLNFLHKSIVNQRAVREGKKRTVRILLTQADDILFAYQRLAAGENIHKGAYRLALLDNTGKSFKAECGFFSIFRGPAALAVQVAGGCGIDQDCPWDIAVVFFQSPACAASSC